MNCSETRRHANRLGNAGTTSSSLAVGVSPSGRDTPNFGHGCPAFRRRQLEVDRVPLLGFRLWPLNLNPDIDTAVVSGFDLRTCGAAQKD